MSKIRTFARYRDGDIEFNAHNCPGLRDCLSHPKRAVSKFRSRYLSPTPWEVWEPHNAGVEFFPTYDEAINHAQKGAPK